jgi:hypothetical protein
VIKELKRICDGKNKWEWQHKVNATESFMEDQVCPIPGCGRPTKLIEEIAKEPRKSAGGGGIRTSEADGFFRGQYIDDRPKLPWFYDIKGLNDENQPRSGQNWSMEEGKKLGKFYTEHGEASAKVWKKISEEEFHRSLAAVERQLRAAISCVNGDKPWEELFPDI